LFAPALVATRAQAQASWRAQFPTLNVAVIPSENQQTVMSRYTALQDYFAKQFGVQVRLFTATDYAGIIEAVKAKRVELAFFGPASYARAFEVTDGNVFFTLQFMPLQSGARLSEVIGLDASLLPAEAYTPDIEVKPIELAFSQVSTTGQPLATRTTLRAQPNPAAGYTQLHFTLPTTDEALLRVLDLNGKVLLEQRARYDAGAHMLPVTFTQAGVYMAELHTSKGVEVVKIIAE
jgi:hypothetical protein